MSVRPLQLIVRHAQPRDTEAIDALRVEGYAAATWFRLEDTRKVMRCNDPASTQVIVAQSARDGELLATVAFTVVHALHDAEDQLGCALPAPAQVFPCSVAMRGAVALAHRGRRLNHLLRWYAIDAARRGGLPQMLSAQAEAAPQRKLTQQLGYEYAEVDKSRLGTVGLPGAMFLVRLHESHYVNALAQLADLLGDTLDGSMWEGPPWTLG